jgi:hypothetical protein
VNTQVRAWERKNVAELAAVTVLSEWAEPLDHADTVRPEIIQRLRDDEKLYIKALRILLTPRCEQAGPLIDLLGEVIEQACGRVTKPAFVITFENLTRYTVDDQGFQQWVARIDPEDLEVDLPTRKSEYPSRDLGRLVTAAIEHGAINGDPRLELTIYEGDDDDGAGYYVVLHNRSGDQRLTGITSGWNELDYVASDATPSEQAREYLAVVCDIANVTLGRTSQTPPSPEVSQP